MNPDDRTPTHVKVLWAVFFAALIAAILYLDPPPRDPCLVDAPMEQSQCRAMGDRAQWRAFWRGR